MQTVVGPPNAISSLHFNHYDLYRTKSLYPLVTHISSNMLFQCASYGQVVLAKAQLDQTEPKHRSSLLGPITSYKISLVPDTLSPQTS